MGWVLDVPSGGRALEVTCGGVTALLHLRFPYGGTWEQPRDFSDDWSYDFR